MQNLGFPMDRLNRSRVIQPDSGHHPGSGVHRPASNRLLSPNHSTALYNGSTAMKTSGESSHLREPTIEQYFPHQGVNHGQRSTDAGWERRSEAPIVGSAPQQPIMHTLLYHHGAVPQSAQQNGASDSPNSAHNAGEVIIDAAGSVQWGKRVMREELIPGRGICYVYEDGSCCPKTVDGDSVNPHWGITKAGKPRKRLAQACTTCREKKIKCDPGSPKCLQCQKFNRECRFEPFTRGSQRSTSPSSVSQSPTTSSMTDTASLLHRDSALCTANETQYHSFSRPLSSSKSSSIAVESLLSPRPVNQQTMDDATESKASKRVRHSATTDTSNSTHPTYGTSNLSTSRKRSLPPPGLELGGRPLRLDVNPFDLDPKLVEHYLVSYFDNINSNYFYLFPRGAFMAWAKDQRQKSPWDNMLLYMMLAFGAHFAMDQRDHKLHSSTFARLVRRAESQTVGKFSLQVVQTRLLLALYNYAKGRYTNAWDYSGAALRAACGMKLHVEGGHEQEKARQPAYNLPPKILVECQRRTFWSTVVNDRSTAFATGQMLTRGLSAYVRLPCDDQMYEQGCVPPTPFFDDEVAIVDGGDTSQQYVGMMGQIAQSMSIWNDLAARTVNLASMERRPHGGVTAADAFYQHTADRLESWQRQLPETLQFTSQNIAEARRRSSLGRLGGMHLLHHCTVMRLNRQVYSSNLDTSATRRRIQTAHEHAVKTMQVVRLLSTTDAHQSKQNISAPIIGFAVVSALDILTSAGTLQDLVDRESQIMRLVTLSIQVLEDLSPYWKATEGQLLRISERYGSLLAAQKGYAAAGKVWFYAADPMQTASDKGLDLIYSLPRKVYLELLGHGPVEESQLLEIKVERLVDRQMTTRSNNQASTGSTWFNDGDDDDDGDGDGDGEVNSDD